MIPHLISGERYCNDLCMDLCKTRHLERSAAESRDLDRIAARFLDSRGSLETTRREFCRGLGENLLWEPRRLIRYCATWHIQETKAPRFHRGAFVWTVGDSNPPTPAMFIPLDNLVVFV